ncbi:MAG TPA: ABC transporter ATP-binding protein [Mycobacteriales bacterium]|nr:ABC transporter ATP-binding protein [Mycobacteriales bacterium]
MRRLPLPDPGIPDTRSPGRFFWWLVRGQGGTIAAGAAFGIAWMLLQAVAPLLVGRALDAGVAAGDTRALIGWTSALAVVGVLQAAAGIGRHRRAVANWMTATYRCNQLVARHAARLGAALPERVAPGEVVNMVASDSRQVGNALDISARLSGAAVSFVVVAVLLLQTSVLLGIVVLVGVPLLMTAVTPLLRPLHRRQAAQRAAIGRLTSLGTDTVAGLRVLRGMGGERTFHHRYAVQSQRVRAAGVETGRVMSVVDAQQVLLPGVFVVVLTWLGARLAVRGDISVGDLIAFYGWAAFLVLPLRTFTEAADKMTRAHVAASRLLALLRAQPTLQWGPRDHWPAAGVLVDAQTGVRVPAGGLHVVACTDAGDGERLADRLGRYVPADVTVGGIALSEFTEEVVRSRVVVVDPATTLFGGALRSELDPEGVRSAQEIADAIDVASADDVVDGLPEGLDTVIGERGRSLSGGQRQRVVLARAVLADPPVLVLVDATSAVDAHTEARIADRLKQRRQERTTVVVTTSPLLLRVADTASLLVDGRLVVQGDRADVVRHPAFRAVADRLSGGDDLDLRESTGAPA